MLSWTLILSIAAILVVAQPLPAQDVSLELKADADHDIRLEGSANIMDWDAQVTTVEAEFILEGFEGETPEELKLEHFKTVNLQIPVEDIIGSPGRFERDMHGYLEKEEHPVITFELIGVNDINPGENGNNVVIDADGRITAAGEEHTINMQVEVETDEEGAWVLSGSQDMRLTDFGIDPPTALLGVIRTEDEFTVIYRARFMNEDM